MKSPFCHVLPTPPGNSDGRKWVTRGGERVSRPDEDITSTILRAAIYARISEDPRGLEHGVSRQLTDCNKLAAARGWNVIATYTDNDISALKGH